MFAQNPTRPQSMRMMKKSGSVALLLLSLFMYLSYGSTSANADSTSSSQPKRATHFQAAPDNTAMLTFKGNNARTGQNLNETILDTTNVNPNAFGKRVSYPLDGQVYAQPLYLPNVTIAGAAHNVVFAATEHDSVYAFDADQTSAVPNYLWHSSLVPSGASVPTNTDVACRDMEPEIGITSTPVIDPKTGTLYVLSYTKENGNFVYRLHALNIADGSEMPGSPVTVSATVNGSGAGSVNGKITFDPLKERNRVGMLLQNNQIYTAYGSFCDNDPYHGWVISYAYNGSSFQQNAVFNSTPDGTRGGIWAAGGALAGDDNGSIYFSSGNGTFNKSGNHNEVGDAIVKLSPDLKITDYFAPFNQTCLEDVDADLGSGGPMLTPTNNHLFEGGKEGRIYILDQNNLGQNTTLANACNNQNRFDVDKVVQETPPRTVGGIFSTPVYWNGSNGENVFYSSVGHTTVAFKLDSTGKLVLPASSQTARNFGFTGGNPVVSSNGQQPGTGVLWMLDPAGLLRAFDATDLAKELYNSNQNSARDSMGTYVKFSSPTVANGEVFVGTSNSLNVYGQVDGGSANPNASFNNAGSSSDRATALGNLDGAGNSYSYQALIAAGISRNQTLVHNGVKFSWPDALPGAKNNYQAIGQTIPVTSKDGDTTLAFLGSSVNGSTSGNGTLHFDDGSSAPFTLKLTDWWAQKPTNGNQVVASMGYYNNLKGRGNVTVSLFYTDVPLPSGKHLKSVTLPKTTGAQMHIFATGTRGANAAPASNGYNNVGITNETSPDLGNIDGAGYSYSAQALQAAGLNTGDNVFFGSVVFTWPNVTPGYADNYTAHGQTLAVDNSVPNAHRLALIGSATNGPSSGTATINYTDGSTQPFVLGFSDWTLGGGTQPMTYSNRKFASLPYRNGIDGRQNTGNYIFYTDVVTQDGKTVKSVTLPTTVNRGSLHVFGVSTNATAAAPAYNNVGITNDGTKVNADFDGVGYTYSAQALSAAKLIPDQSVTFNGVDFIWPNVPAGSPDNYDVKGQAIPINLSTHAKTLAFLGSSNNGPSTAKDVVVTYTDGSTQKVDISFGDWAQANTIAGNTRVVDMPYRNVNRNGQGFKQNMHVYLFYTEVTLQDGKDVQSIMLPGGASKGNVHIFSIGSK